MKINSLQNKIHHEKQINMHGEVTQKALNEQTEEVALFEKKDWPDFRNSWLMRGEEGPIVLTSVATTGFDSKGERHELAGSMSPMWGQPYDTRLDLGGVSIQELNLMPAELVKLKDSVNDLDQEKHKSIADARREASRNRVMRYLEIIGGPELENDVIIIKPQSDHYKDRSIKGNIVCADDVERNGHYIEDVRPAFMLYSHDPNRVVGIRPADCPTVAFFGHNMHGESVHGLMHGGWQDEDASFLDQGLAFLKNELNCNIKDLNFSIAPGGVNFEYKRPTDPRDGNDPMVVHDGWKTRTTNHQKVEGGVSFIFDMHGFAVDRIREAGAADEQIFVDSTDTTSDMGGHSSHKRASQGKIAPMRDLVLVLSPDRQ